MSGNVALQADLGTLGVAGLGAFTQVLSAITADNIAPMALIQLEQLGNLFLCNGKFAKKMPDLLQRSKSYRMAKLELMVGWRKNDASSYLANTSGGQAIALLIGCLPNLREPGEVGEILHELCSKNLPRSLHIASPSQLSEAASCIFAKVSPVGFTHHLAETLTRIRQVYMSLSMDAPTQLLAGTRNEYLVDFLDGLTHSLREDDTILRVTGSWDMGAIAALGLMICPEDTVVTVEKLIIHQGSRQNVLIEISEDSVNSPSEFFTTKFTLEKPLTGSHQKLSPIIELKSFDRMISSRAIQHTYLWDSWLLDTARLRFAELGFIFPEQSASLIASIIVKMHHFSRIYSEDCKSVPLTCWNLLGTEPGGRLSAFCQKTLRTQPCYTEFSIEDLVKMLLEECFRSEPMTHQYLNVRGVELRKEQLVRDLASLIQDGFVAVFLDPGDNVTITSSRVWRTERDSEHDGQINHEVTPMDYHVHELCRELQRFDDMEDIHHLLSVIFGILHRKGPLWANLRKSNMDESLHPESYEFFGQANDCCIMYPAVLDEMELPSSSGLRYRYEAGYFLLQDRRYKKLRASDIPEASYQAKSVDYLPWPMRPLGIGRHEQAVWTFLERYDSIELRLDIITDGRRENISVPGIVAASCSLEVLPQCGHLRDEPLLFKDAFPSDETFEVDFAGACVLWGNKERTMGVPPKPRITFSLTKGSPDAQLYSLAMTNRVPKYRKPWRYFLQGDSCMTCAIERCQLDRHGAFVILE